MHYDYSRNSSRFWDEGDFISPRKFCASYPSVLEAVPPDCREMEVPIELDSNEGIKTLGLLWHPLSDQFLISKGTCAQKLREPKKSPVSKRIIYSIIAALQRFIAITGLTDHLYSDNCSNFVGANRELKVFIKSEEFLRHVHNYAAKTQFQWHFIPLNSPHFGRTVGSRCQIFNPYPTAFPYGNGMVLHFTQQQESSTTKTVHRVINKGLKTYV